MGLVDSVLQTFTGLEFWLVGCRDLNLFASARVPALGGFPLRHVECAESDQPDFLACLQRVGDRLKYAINGLCGISFGKTSSIGNCCHQIIFVNGRAPSLGQEQIEIANVVYGLH